MDRVGVYAFGMEINPSQLEIQHTYIVDFPRNRAQMFTTMQGPSGKKGSR